MPQTREIRFYRPGRKSFLTCLPLPSGDAYSVTDVAADAIDGSAKVPSTPIRLPSSRSPAVLMENILKRLPNLRIDPAGKSEVVIELFLYLVSPVFRYICNLCNSFNASNTYTVYVQATSKLHIHRHTTQNTAWSTGMQMDTKIDSMKCRTQTRITSTPGMAS